MERVELTRLPLNNLRPRGTGVERILFAATVGRQRRGDNQHKPAVARLTYRLAERQPTHAMSTAAMAHKTADIM